MSVRNLVKSIQDIMRQDVGVDGDAQRISQLCWMFFYPRHFGLAANLPASGETATFGQQAVPLTLQLRTRYSMASP